MPSTPTITAFYDFVPRTRIVSAEVDNNFSVFRGDIIPVTPDTATAADLTYDLGSITHRWDKTYLKQLFFADVTTAGLLFEGRTDGKGINVIVGGSTVTSIDAGGISGGLGFNYVSNDDAEADTTGWATYADAAGTSPVDGTGGAPTLTFTRTTTTPLRDGGSFLITKDAANRQGNGASYDFTIDLADESKVLSVSFDYEIPSGTFSGGTDSADSDITVWVYDVTNALVIQPAGYKIQGSVIGQKYKFVGTFQTASNSVSYRLIFHVGTTSASAYTLEIDSVQVGPQIVQYGAPINDWKSVTASLPSIAAFGAYTNEIVRYRRVGDSLELNADWITGTVGASAAYMTLPFGLTINTTKFTSTNDVIRVGVFTIIGGTAALINSTNKEGAVYIDAAQPTRIYLTDQVGNGGTVEFTPRNGNDMVGNSQGISLFCSVPILGWGSSVEMSNDTDTRIVAMRASGDPASATVGNPVIFPTADYDTHGVYSVSTGLYTVAVPGYYRVHGYIVSANATITIQIAVDGATVISGGITDANGEGTYTGTVKVNSGQTIAIEPSGTLDAATGSTLHIEKMSGPSAIAASEDVNARASGDPASATVGNPIIWPTADWDTHGAYGVSTGLYTVPVAGKYRVSGYIVSANATITVNIAKDGATDIAGGVTDANGECTFTGVSRATAGQTLSIEPSGTLDVTSGHILFERIGNY